MLNINAETVFLGYMLYKLGIDVRFKISVMLGNDSPYTGLWTLLGAKLFEREDGTSPLIGLNWSNAANNETLRSASQLRSRLGFEDVVRFEHHIVQCRWGTVIQPYDRREELMELAATVPNISAKHEGGDVEAEAALLAEGKHASNVLDYFREKAEILEAGDWDALLNNYIEKHNAVNHTARELTKHGLSFIAASKLHRSAGQ